MILNILLPDKTLNWDNVLKLIVKTTKGTITLLDNHIPLITSINEQIISFQADQQTWQFNISEGLLMFDKHKIKIWLRFANDLNPHD